MQPVTSSTTMEGKNKYGAYKTFSVHKMLGWVLTQKKPNVISYSEKTGNGKSNRRIRLPDHILSRSSPYSLINWSIDDAKSIALSYQIIFYMKSFDASTLRNMTDDWDIPEYFPKTWKSQAQRTLNTLSNEVQHAQDNGQLVSILYKLYTNLCYIEYIGFLDDKWREIRNYILFEYSERVETLPLPLQMLEELIDIQRESLSLFPQEGAEIAHWILSSFELSESNRCRIRRFESKCQVLAHKIIKRKEQNRPTDCDARDDLPDVQEAEDDSKALSDDVKEEDVGKEEDDENQEDMESMDVDLPVAPRRSARLQKKLEHKMEIDDGHAIQSPPKPRGIHSLSIYIVLFEISRHCYNK